MFKTFSPPYSAKNLLADVPKKFVTKVVIIREKLNNMLMEPRTSLPKVRATRKLNINGTIPINDRAKPVYSEFFTIRFLNKRKVLLIFASVNDNC